MTDAELKAMIHWRKPSEERPNYDNIWVIDGHWKESVPLSYRIVACRRLYAGPENEEHKIQLTTDDEHGEGSWGPDWDDVVAWCYVREVELLPSWVQK